MTGRADNDRSPLAGALQHAYPGGVDERAPVEVDDRAFNAPLQPRQGILQSRRCRQVDLAPDANDLPPLLDRVLDDNNIAAVHPELTPPEAAQTENEAGGSSRTSFIRDVSGANRTICSAPAGGHRLEYRAGRAGSRTGSPDSSPGSPQHLVGGPMLQRRQGLAPARGHPRP